MPGYGVMPEIWLLGSSTYSAQLAGMLGLPFGFAYHFSPEPLDEAVALYRSNFTPSGFLEAPRVLIVAPVLCAPTTEEAIYLAGPGRLSMLLLRHGRPSTIPTPQEAAEYPYSDLEVAEITHASQTHIVGDPSAVERGLAQLIERTGADEIMLSTRTHGFAERLRSVELTNQILSTSAGV